MDFSRPMRVVTPTLDGDVLAVLSRSREELSGRETHRLVGRGSEQGVRRVLNRLVDEGVVLSRPAGQARLFSLNRDHLAAARIEELADARAQLIHRLREAIATWRPKPIAAVLFGSVARGKAKPHSDIDLLVVRPARVDEDSPAWRSQLDRLGVEAKSWTGNDARLLEFGEDELKVTARERVLREAARDGIDLAAGQRLRATLMGAGD